VADELLAALCPEEIDDVQPAPSTGATPEPALLGRSSELIGSLDGALESRD
jgi:hypothetical protein